MLALTEEIRKSRKRWLVTGVAGFIGSHLLRALLELDQDVIGIDNFSTGFKRNLDDVKEEVSSQRWSRFSFFESDLRDAVAMSEVCQGIDCVLHQGALGSVPRSIEDPAATNASNVDGFLNILVAAKNSGVSRFIYASSSSVYGDSKELPKREAHTGNPLSPYAASKHFNEVYASVFSGVYGIETIGLRYFNVFGPRQDPEGAYAAVIPRWILALKKGRQCTVYGDGKTSRDFCYIENVVQANLLAALTDKAEALNRVYNIAVGETTDLLSLYQLIARNIKELQGAYDPPELEFHDFRRGDVRHSLADITCARQLLGYKPRYNVELGMKETVAWYFR